MNKALYRCVWFYRKVVRKLTKKRIDLKKYGTKTLLSNAKANQLIAEKLKSGEPFMAARIGSVELNVIVSNEKKVLKNKKSKMSFDALHNNAGFFPKEGSLIPKYCKLMYDSCEDVDLLGVWSNEMEDYIVEKYCGNTQLCRLMALEPWNVENPWSEALEGKKVLVIHPFEKTIQSQYHENRTNIFKGTKILPEFEELDTVKAVQTIAGEKDPRFQDWFEALNWMYEEALKKDFDVAIVGCGAYGLPLASMLKRSGKQVIHMGGATQLLFGIKGKRWDEMPQISKWYNDAWVRPNTEEQPSKRNLVEEGCYW